MYMTGTAQSKVTVTLRNPLNYNDQLEYYIIPNDSQLAKDWIEALKTILRNQNQLARKKP